MTGRRPGGAGATRRDSDRATWPVIVTAVLLFAGVRGLFILDNPDWSVIGSEHCFFLTMPRVYADRLALETDGDLPFWVVNPTQLKTILHGGAAWMAHCTRLASQVLGSRSLAVLKVVGTLHAVLFAGLLAWALTRVFGRPADRYQIWTPIMLAAVPPVFFLWVTLLPMGHYFETHVFYGLMLPFVVSACHGRAGPALLAYTGSLAGLAIVYSFSNVVLLALAVALCLLFVREPLKRRALAAAGLVVVAGVAFVVFGRPGDVAGRLLGSALLAPETRDAAGLGGAATIAQLIPTLGDHVQLLFGPQDPSWGPAGFGQVLATGVIAGVCAGGAVVLLVALGRTLRDLRQPRVDSQRAFLAAHGLLLLLFVAAYLAFDPYTRARGNTTFIYYLCPIYPSLFVGCGAALSSLARLRPIWAPWFARFVAASGGAALLWGCVNSYAVNSRPLQRPEFGSCDDRYLYGYFLAEPPAGGSPEVPLWEDVAVVERESGEQRCEAARPYNGDTCELVGHALAAIQAGDGRVCEGESGPRAVNCARAVGAVNHGCSENALPAVSEICTEFLGDLRAACVSGAYQAIHPNVPACSTLWRFIDECDQTFAGEPALSACREQVAALLIGAPALPPAPDPVAPVCATWPGPWQGLCQRAARAAAAPAGGPDTCESVYMTQFSAEVPHWSDLSFQQCLTEMGDFYAYCAIGVAREAGRTDCRWGGGAEAL